MYEIDANNYVFFLDIWISLARQFVANIDGGIIYGQIGELLMKRAIIEGWLIVRLVLLMLATRFGTFLLCGSLCLGEKWPFIYNFSRMSLDKREKVVQKWLRHKFLTPFRLAFLYIKVVCFHTFFSRVIINTLSLNFSFS